MTPEDRKRTDELVKTGEIAEALRSYQKAYLQNPTDEDALLGIAQCAWMLDNTDVALEFFVKLLVVNHHHPWGYLGRGMVLLQANASEQGLRDIHRALEIDSPPTEMRIDAAAALNANGLPDEALQALLPIRKQFIDDPDFRMEWLTALIAIQDYNHPDILEILDEELSRDRDESEIDLRYFYELCNFARLEDCGRLPTSSGLMDAIVRNCPDLTDRAQMLAAI